MHPAPSSPASPSSRASASIGITLIETTIVLAVLGVLLSVTVPSFARFLSNHRASVAANDFVHAMALARGEALKRGRRVYLAPLGDRWRDGWAVFVDRDDDRAYDAERDETIAIHDALPPSVELTKTTGTGEPFLDSGAPRRAYLMFDASGYPRQRSGALHFGSILVVDRTGGAVTMRTLCVGSYGRVRVVLDRATC